MKPFRFPLDRVLEWRREELETEQAALRALHAERERLQARRRWLEESLEAERRALVASATVESQALEALESWKVWVRGEFQRLGSLAQELERRIAVQRFKTLEAQRKVKLLERLREKAFQRWTAELNRELENFAAEAYLARWRPG
jgi:flagellar FliJ protein